VLALSTLLLALSFYAFAQQVTKTPRIGLLLSGFPSGAARRIQAFQQGLRELGYVEGKNMVIEYRYAEGKLEPLTELAAELVHLKVDIIVTDTSNATQAAKDATKTIPVVFQHGE
jgi:putative ABC transport system substrate-binding protein